MQISPNDKNYTDQIVQNVMCINEVVIYGTTAKIPQTCALFSIF